jgi:hypothetical protein
MNPTRRWPLTAQAPRPGRATAQIARPWQGVPSSVVRLPPTVHGDGDHGFMATISASPATRASPATSATIQPPARRAPPRCRAPVPSGVGESPPGSTLHAVADEGGAIRDVADVIGRHLDLRCLSSLPMTQASVSPGWAPSSRPTARPQARCAANCWAGSQHIPPHRGPRPRPLLPQPIRMTERRGRRRSLPVEKSAPRTVERRANRTFASGAAQTGNDRRDRVDRVVVEDHVRQIPAGATFDEGVTDLVLGSDEHIRTFENGRGVDLD